jgi:uncharacterized membrane protein (UPF0182 family)
MHTEEATQQDISTQQKTHELIKILDLEPIKKDFFQMPKLMGDFECMGVINEELFFTKDKA